MPRSGSGTVSCAGGVGWRGGVRPSVGEDARSSCIVGVAGGRAPPPPPRRRPRAPGPGARRGGDRTRDAKREATRKARQAATRKAATRAARAHHGIGRRTGGRTYDAALRDGLRWRRCMPRRIRDAQGRRPAFVRRVSRSVRPHASRARQTGGRVSSPERGGQTRQTESAAPALVRRRLVCHGGAPVRVRPGSAHTRCVQRSAAAHDAKKKRRGGLGR